MNCLEFRRNLLIDPRSTQPLFLAHAANCPDCGREHERALRFEQSLYDALSVDRPPGLESRVLLARSLRDTHRRWGISRRQWLAMAATLLIAVGLVGLLGPVWERESGGLSGLPQVVLNHVEDEKEFLHIDMDVRPSALRALFAQFGAQLSGNIGHVSYAGRCHIRKASGIHLVLRGEAGPVTVLFMPGEYLLHSEPFDASGFSGLVEPTGFGSLAVVGERSESLQRVLERVREAVHWI